ncbi:MAG: class F420-dependent oxidoreductase [Actinomycetia bacterium]|nr:class F420-dependent oxidoreductase [Actinomycetes bacterium]
MRFSVTMVPTDLGIPVAALARAVEERGLDGLWFPDHTHIPVSRTTPYPLGGDLPARYHRILEPVVALAMAASSTDRIRLGTGILLVGQRDPIVTAKALATIDQQSGGRVAVGVGYGWNVEEMVDHGVDPRTRRARVREHVLAMRRLWEDEVATYDGAFVTFAPSWSWPKPVQGPLPVLVGGAPTDATFRHVAELGQGWIPTGGHGLAEAVPRLRDHLEAAGRDPLAVEIVPFTTGELSHDKVDRLEAAGATEVAFDVPPLAASEVLPILDGIATFATARREGR